MIKKLTVSLALPTLLFSSQAHAVESHYYYDGLGPANLATGYTLAKSTPNSSVIMKRTTNSNTSPLQSGPLYL